MVIMEAKTKLFALVANDPSHPAVLETLSSVFAVIFANRENTGRCMKTDLATLVCVEIMLIELAKTLERG